MLNFIKENLIEKQCQVALEDTIIGRVDRAVFPYLYKSTYKTPMDFIKRNHRAIEKMIVITLALALTVCETVYAGTNDIDRKGNELMVWVWRIARWVVLVMGVWESSRAIFDGNVKEVPKIVMKYLFAYASMRGLEWGINFIDGV